MSTSSPSLWNLPNLLTLVRILMIPAVMALLLDDPAPGEAILAAALFLGAMLTDLVDGWLARRWNQMSAFGAYMDPLADKLMVSAVLIMLIPLGWAPAWLVFLLLAREMAITGLRSVASQEGLVLAAGTMGKTKTAFQSAALTHYPLLGVDMHSAGTVLLWIATFFAMTSGLEYILLTIQAIQKKATAAPSPTP